MGTARDGFFGVIGAGSLAEPVVTGGAAASHPPPTAIAQALRDVLARPEFAPGDTSPLIPAWLRRGLEEISRWLAGLHSTAPLLFWLLVGGCVVLLLVLLGHIGWTVRSAFFVGTEVASDRPTPERRRVLSAAHRDEAHRQAMRGDFTEAIRFLFLSLVFRYDERGSVSFRRSYTNREYLALFHDQPQMHAVLKVFVDALDQHWYGRAPTDGRVYDECLLLYDSVI